MKMCHNGEMVEMSADAEAEMNRIIAASAAEDRHRPMSQSEVVDKMLRRSIQTLAKDDGEALRMRSYYPDWTPGLTAKVGQRYQHKGELYRCLQGHTTQAGWEPGPGTESMWVRIDEEHDGTEYDPIPYKGNMVLEKGLYYTQDGKVYRCIRSSGNAVYDTLEHLATVQGGGYVTPV